MPSNNTPFSEAYKIKCRAIWYDNGCPSAKKMVELNLLPEDEQGNTASQHTFRIWMVDESWYQWKDVLDAKLSEKVENELLRSRMEIIQEQLTQNRDIRNKAYDNISKGTFDSSAAAVSAFFKASAEERGLMQVQKVIEDLTKMNTSSIQQKIKELAERAGATVVDTETVESTEDKEEVAESLD